MSKVTYQTRLSDSVKDFGDAMGLLFGKIERDLYKDLGKGKKLNDLKKSYQVKYQINARQFNSIHLILKGKIASRKECHQRQIKELKSRIKGLTKRIKADLLKLKKTPLSCGLGKNLSERSKLKFSIHFKQRKLARLQNRLTSLKKINPSFVFGGKKLWKAQFNLEDNGYKNHQEWLADWVLSRSSQFTLVGSKDEKLGFSLLSTFS